MGVRGEGIWTALLQSQLPEFDCSTKNPPGTKLCVPFTGKPPDNAKEIPFGVDMHYKVLNATMIITCLIYYLAVSISTV